MLKQKWNIDKSTFVLVALCMGVLYTQAHAQQAPKPVFTLDFSKGMSATGAAGQKIPARLEGTFITQDSPHGKAMRSGPGAGYLHFPAKNIINPKSGTVEMWVSPLDWDGSEDKFHVFFDARGQGSIYLYKYYQGGLKILTAPKAGGPYYSVNADIKNWKPGQWHFIAGTWSQSRLAVYVDGKLVKSATQLSLPASISGEFEIGDDPWEEPGISRTSQSLVADVRIYDRALSAQHIAAHFKGDYDTVILPSLQNADLDWTVDAKTRAITPSIAIAESDSDAVNLRVDFTLLENKTIVQERRDRPFNEALISNATFKAISAPGDYTLRVALHDTSGKNYGETSKTLTVPDMAQWMNNTIGENAGVLPPWTPLQVQKKTDGGFLVLCWGREYQFGASAWPTQIVSKKEKLLAAPIRLKVLLGGKEVVWKNASAKVVSQSPETVEIEGRAVADSGLVLSTKMRLEYDGMMLTTMHLQVPHNSAPDNVTLDIPLRASNALYRHRYTAAPRREQKTFTGALEQKEGVIDSSPYLPAAWLGDNDRGLFWFCESAQFWPNWKSKTAFQTVRENNAVTQRFTLLNGQPLPDNWDYQFGLQATPVKPFPNNWRAHRLAPLAGATLETYWPNGEVSSTHFRDDAMYPFGYPAAANPELFQKRVDESHSKGRLVIPYSLLNGIAAKAPEWKWFHDIWDVHHLDPPVHLVSPTQETWRDFVIWKSKGFMEKYKLDGFYNDLTYPYGWAVPEANTGWFDGKEWQQTFPMLAYRKLYRRDYAMVKQNNPNAFLIGHISSRMAIPVVGYEDAFLDGEQFRGKVKDSYMDVMSLDQWRTTFTGRQWGVIPIFLPEFDAETAAKIKPTRGLAALLMLHDITTVWPNWSNVKVWNKMYNALDKFGYVKSTFIPYWSSQPPASTDMKDVYISAYKRNDGRALLVVGNTSREPRQGTVTLNANALNLPIGKVLLWPDGTPLADQNGKINISMDGLDYRLILVEKPPA